MASKKAEVSLQLATLLLSHEKALQAIHSEMTRELHESLAIEGCGTYCRPISMVLQHRTRISRMMDPYRFSLSGSCWRRLPEACLDGPAL
jgi:hypothetical protein